MQLKENEVAEQVCHFTSIEDVLKGNKNNINILWSGGCDSTLVLYWLLEWLKNLNDNRVINAFSFHHNQLNDNKMDWERQKRHRFIMWAEDKGYNNKIVHREITFSKDVIFIGDNSSCCQPAVWISQLIPIINDNSMIFAGYHRGDDFFTYSTFNDWLKMFVSMNNMFGKTTRFYSPLVMHSKNDIIKLIKNIDGLYNNTWWCEGSSIDGKPCGTCLPCKNHETALIYYERELAKNVQISENLKATIDDKPGEKPFTAATAAAATAIASCENGAKAASG